MEEISKMDTVELREWLYTQSDDAVVATIAQLRDQLQILTARLEVAKELLERTSHTDAMLFQKNQNLRVDIQAFLTDTQEPGRKKDGK